ncbi:MAG TPA: glycerophosphodiester phosphodiesterase [Candidatus Saccharimonadales bacterium]|nr:glycerophosphodiester phosphodiesterase [Candidatus Saccharimonadales bacterium]
MAKTGIIGHRGAAGLALENSHDSMLAALNHEIDGIEFDVRRTKDGRLVVLHDSHTGRIAKQKVLISYKTLEELQAIKLKNGQHIPSLEEVFELIGDRMTMVVDIKDSGSADELLRILNEYPKAKVQFTSLKYGELAKLHKVRPDLPIFVRDLLNPFEIVHTARRMRAEGISLNMWLMNPLTYWLAKRRNLEIRIYTVNNAFMVKFFKKLYPGIVIYTNHPDRFVGKLQG